MYLEAVLDGFNAVRARPHVSRTPAFRACADSLVPFLACNFRESCIASPDMREMLLQTVSILLQSKPFVARFEASSDARAHLVRPVAPLLCLLSQRTALVTSSCESWVARAASWQLALMPV